MGHIFIINLVAFLAEIFIFLVGCVYLFLVRLIGSTYFPERLMVLSLIYGLLVVLGAISFLIPMLWLKSWDVNFWELNLFDIFQVIAAPTMPLLIFVLHKSIKGK